MEYLPPSPAEFDSVAISVMSIGNIALGAIAVFAAVVITAFARKSRRNSSMK